VRKRSLTFNRAVLASAALLGLQACALAVDGKADTGTAAASVAAAAAHAASSAKPSEGAPPRQTATSTANEPGTHRAAIRWSMSERDKTLKAALERWAQKAGWRLFWEMGVDYRIDAAMSIDGSFEDAVSAVVRNMEQADVPPRAIFYRGNQVLRVLPRGME
jgi:hypothetical protein